MAKNPKPPNLGLVSTADAPVRETVGTVVETLRVALTPEELTGKSKALGTLVVERRTLVAKHSVERKAMKEAETALQEEIEELGEDVALGAEKRPVQCEIIIDHARNVREIVREDTGELVREESLVDDAHKQTRLS